MKKTVKKTVTIVLLMAFLASLLTGCAGITININVADSEASAPSEETKSEPVETAASEEDEVPFRDQGIWYMGGLVTNEEGFDMKLGFYRIDGEPVAIVTDGEDIYYGYYETEDTKFDDGTEFTLISVGGKKFGYKFNDDNNGFLVDNNDNMIEAVELDEKRAMELMNSTDMAYEEPDYYGFVQEQSGLDSFKDFDDLISHLKPGQGYAYIRLKGTDEDILALTDMVFEADNSACEADLFRMTEDKPLYMGVVSGNGSAYPLRIADGILYGGDNHTYESYFTDSDNHALMMKDYVYDGINEGTQEYGGFLRSANVFDQDKDFTGGAEEFQKLLEEREKAPAIKFTVVP